MRDKRADEMIAILREIGDNLILTKAENIRSADPEDLPSRNAATPVLKMRVAPTSGDALREAITSTPPDGLIVVTGSLYLVGEIRNQLVRRSE